jgi:hypothetical protein
MFIFKSEFNSKVLWHANVVCVQNILNNFRVYWTYEIWGTKYLGKIDVEFEAAY